MTTPSLALTPLRTMADGARCRQVCRTADYEATLVHYPADLIHPDHEHERAQISFLLCGGFGEIASGRESAPIGSRHGFRPPGARHSCRFGRGGALILSVNLMADAHISLEPGHWHRSSAGMVELFGLLLGGAAAAEDLIADLLASTGPRRATRRPTGSGAPRWLRRVAQELVDDPSAGIAAIAESAGVHRVYLSRVFQKHFGHSPTHFRLHCRSALALRYMVEDGATPGSAAAAAGFADQAHWTRASGRQPASAPGGSAICSAPEGYLRSIPPLGSVLFVSLDQFSKGSG